LVRGAFSAAGCSVAEAARIAHYLVEANLAGHDSHGVIRVPRYLNWLNENRLVPDQKVSIITENEAFAVVDGRFGFGQTVGPQAVEFGVDKAARHGVSVIALRNSGHLGRIGDWAEMAAAAGQVSVHFVNVAGSVLVAPFGGVERRMSTGPIAVGVPLEGGPPLILDFATSKVAEGKVLVAAKGGRPIPPDSLIDADGSFSGEPEVLYGPGDRMTSYDMRDGTGAIRAMGEHKGSGLALVCEILGGALTGSGCAGPQERQIANGMLSLYMSPAVFDSGHAFAAEVRQYLDFFRSAKPATPGGEVLLPGEPERRTRATRLAEGINLPAEGWEAILGAARSAGLSDEQIEAAVA
jgi:uncharacterized oxidoreductase